MDTNWCLVCDKATAGNAYCSELCRRVDLAKSMRAGPPALVAAPSWAPSSASTTASAAHVATPPASPTIAFPSFSARRASLAPPPTTPLATSFGASLGSSWTHVSPAVSPASSPAAHAPMHAPHASLHARHVPVQLAAVQPAAPATPSATTIVSPSFTATTTLPPKPICAHGHPPSSSSSRSWIASSGLAAAKSSTTSHVHGAFVAPILLR
ncbi:hypothetical protein AMAG_05077 [Allomyces macrogynus ATCC 38327]|uniref:Uncharacterized protein n=1 Tax=Allomyces macrogynus (strain ATCC 38327) TaxID=578462 RepID=A0A0L0S6V6_ALLM3|nr:hypothetical protein AMAG_05077 [Allomyces macrogynus ATCC 38327]|eukprot:KNE58267.1 hypothetical protein AMAG_05077 [Allomyces macrogynus ATCC 38327]